MSEKTIRKKEEAYEEAVLALNDQLVKLHEKIKRLDAAGAAKDRAIRRLVTVIFDEWNKLEDTREANAADDEATAALSSAGEDWLPPEVRESAKRVLGELQWAKDGHCPWCSVHKVDGHDDDCGLATALDALEKVE